MKLGNTEIKGKAVLAPMAGVTDRAFRELCMGFGAAYCTSEMVSAKGLIMRSFARVRSLCHMPDGIALHSSATNDLRSPGATLSALSADSMRMVPEPQQGSMTWE